MGGMDSMQAEIDCLRREVGEMEKKLKLKEAELRTKCEELDNANGKIRFLEGQIEAYQYCMNCRR